MRSLLHSIVPWPRCRRRRSACLLGSSWQIVYDMHAVRLCQALLYPEQYRKLQLAYKRYLPRDQIIQSCHHFSTLPISFSKATIITCTAFSVEP